MYETNRKLTRDLLLEYNKIIMPPRPRAAGLASAYLWGMEPITKTTTDVPVPIQQDISIVYPWENESLAIFSHNLYLVAMRNGFIGTENDFFTHFINFVSEKEIIFDTYNNFPANGGRNYLYFDLDEKILYYWDEEYIPVNAMLIANTVIEGGEA